MPLTSVGQPQHAEETAVVEARAFAFAYDNKKGSALISAEPCIQPLTTGNLTT